MRTRPNYFKFRQWLNWAMKDNPLGNDHFHADEIYQDNLLDETEKFPPEFILSYGASMLEDARKYYRKHTYLSKIPVFACGFDEFENYVPSRFENDDFIPDFSTIEKTVALFPNNGFTADITFCTYPLNLYKQSFQGYKFLKCICTTAPLWFGSQYNMVYHKWMIESKYGDPFVDHWAGFYHNSAINYFPFEKDKWISLTNNSEYCQ